jgi:hypothetical protein
MNRDKLLLIRYWEWSTFLSDKDVAILLNNHVTLIDAFLASDEYKAVEPPITKELQDFVDEIIRMKAYYKKGSHGLAEGNRGMLREKLDDIMRTP